MSNHVPAKMGNPAWVPGVSGNPAGRPKRGETFRDCLHRLTSVPIDDARTRKQVICDRMIELAEEGNLPAAQWIVERLEGKAVQSIELSKKSELLQGLSDDEVREMIEAIKGRRAIASDNNADNA